MQLQPVSSYLNANPRTSSPIYDNPTQSLFGGGKRGLGANATGTAHLSATIEAEYLKAESTDLEFSSADGDKVTLSTQSVQYQKAVLQIEADGSPEDMKKIADYIKEQYKSLQEELKKSFLKSINGDDSSTQGTSGTTPSDQLQIPDYWNAENTSQRIVDFATSLFDAYKGAGNDFLKMIKDAIEKGFKEAKDMLGKLPDAISKLVNDTHDLVMQKLDAWAKEKGIVADAEPEQNNAASATTDSGEAIKIAA
jgi:hypothetical protein